MGLISAWTGVGRKARVAGVLIGITLATGAYAAWLFTTQLGVGWYRDDGVYAIAAHAIADGRGPRLDFLPGAPYLTKYPLFWPAVLAAVLAVTKTSGAGLTGPIVVAPNALFIPLALVAYGAILHRSWRLPRGVVALLLLALALSPAVLEFARFPMSEITYLALSLGAIALSDASGSPPSRKREFLAAALAVAAMHTRLAGVTLVAALLIAFAVRRRLLAFLFTGGLASVSVAGWLAYLRHAWIVDAPAHASRVLAYDLSYGHDWVSSRLENLPQIFVQACQGVYFSTEHVFGALFPRRLLDEAAAGESAVPLITLVIAYLVLAVVGAWIRFSSSVPMRPLARAETAYIPLALALAMVWHTATWRLFAPLAPWLLVLPLKGLSFLTRSPRKATLTGAAVLVILAVIGIPYNRPPGPRIFMAGGMPVHMDPLERALDAIQKLPPSSRIGSPMTPLVYLRTGRLGVETWVGEPVTGPRMEGRSIRTFYVRGGRPDIPAAYRAVYAALEEYPRLGVGYAFSRLFPAPDFFLVAAENLPGARTIFRSPEYQLVALPWSAPRHAGSLFPNTRSR